MALNPGTMWHLQSGALVDFWNAAELFGAAICGFSPAPQNPSSAVSSSPFYWLWEDFSGRISNPRISERILNFFCFCEYTHCHSLLERNLSSHFFLYDLRWLFSLSLLPSLPPLEGGNTFVQQGLSFASQNPAGLMRHADLRDLQSIDLRLTFYY